MLSTLIDRFLRRCDDWLYGKHKSAIQHAVFDALDDMSPQEVIAILRNEIKALEVFDHG